MAELVMCFILSSDDPVMMAYSKRLMHYVVKINVGKGKPGDTSYQLFQENTHTKVSRVI